MGSLYSEHRTWLHAVPASVKLLALALLSTGLLLTDRLAILLPAAALCALMFLSLGSAMRPARRLVLSVLIAALLVAGFHAFIQGEALAFSADSRFDEDAGFWKDGERLAASLAGDKRTQPFVSLPFMLSEFRRRGITVPKGAIVTTGTLCVPFDTSSPGYYEARLGSARLGLTLA